MGQLDVVIIESRELVMGLGAQKEDQKSAHTEKLF